MTVSHFEALGAVLESSLACVSKFLFYKVIERFSCRLSRWLQSIWEAIFAVEVDAFDSWVNSVNAVGRRDRSPRMPGK